MLDRPVFKPDKCAPRVCTSSTDLMFIASHKTVLHYKEYDSEVGGRNGKNYEDRSFFIELKKQCPNLQKYSDLAIKNYVKRFNESLCDLVVEHRDGILLPMKCGIMMVATFGKCTTRVCYKSSEQAGELRYFTNRQSEGMGGGIYYTSRWKVGYMSDAPTMYANGELWRFEAGRNLARRIRKAYDINWKKYWKLSPSRRLKDIIDTYKTKMYRKRKENKIKEDYDEFKF